MMMKLAIFRSLGKRGRQGHHHVIRKCTRELQSRGRQSLDRSEGWFMKAIENYVS